MLAAARDLVRRAGWRNVSLVRAGAAELPPVGGFDGVLSVLGLSAVPEHRRALRRCRDVLGEGRRLVVCDARLFDGPLRVVNPLLQAVYSRWAAWDPDRDLVGDIRAVFGDVDVTYFNAGSFFVATATKPAGDGNLPPREP